MKISIASLRMFLFCFFVIFCTFSKTKLEANSDKTVFKDIKIVTHLREINTKMLLIDKKTGYLNIKDISKAYYADINTKQISKSIELIFSNEEKKDSKKIVTFYLEKPLIFFNDNKMDLDKIPIILNKDIYLPFVVFIGEFYNNFVEFETTWDVEKSILKVIRINTAEKLSDNLEKLEDIPDSKLNFDANTKKEYSNNDNEQIIYEYPTSEYSVDIIKNIEDINLDKNKGNLKEKKKKINTIIIDAGHGGQDSGAYYGGVKEKDLNLKVAKKLAKILKEKYSKNIIMTRDTDIFIPLRERTDIANQNNGDIFISIHANAAPNRTEWNGFEIYFLSETASDAEAEAVAQYENAVLNLEEKINTDLNMILWSMVINEYINESSEFCHFVSKNIKTKVSNLGNRGVKQAGFVVLKGAKMPAVLVEMGYMTNKKELILLQKDSFQNQIAKAIAASIVDYENDEK
ncbi:MAG: N-acetylmuramoyl-L-alanine amidase [Elusimicrobiota bacterium]|jgi:N-acetylmuramoyl-L-alanine amidase|nr:N-acetylmuramoyl-L-alanine amidase [Elusimicrobiota bacterium]